MNQRMPVLFVGHGSPMNAVEDNEFSRAWIKVGSDLPVPRAVVCISAHWETEGTQVNAMEKPKTIYDFYGFPPELYAVKYPAPGSPALAQQLCSMLTPLPVKLDNSWGLDHGAWSVLCRLFPHADIPVIQLSLDVLKSARAHYDLGKQLKPLRDEGILILGSGNVVHNLRILNWNDSAYDWAVEFDAKVARWVLEDDHESAIEYHLQGSQAALAVNSAEHYKPFLYILGAREPGEAVTFFAQKVTLGSISMRSMLIG
jgi:4,5-DOPA dioxygenase extradiol